MIPPGHPPSVLPPMSQQATAIDTTVTNAPSPYQLLQEIHVRSRRAPSPGSWFFAAIVTMACNGDGPSTSAQDDELLPDLHADRPVLAWKRVAAGGEARPPTAEVEGCRVRACTSACTDTLDCQDHEYCHPQLDRCLERPTRASRRSIPSLSKLDVRLEWSFEADDVITIPIVGDIDGDRSPEVIITTWNATDPDGFQRDFHGELIVIDGTTGKEQFRIDQDPINNSYGPYGRSTPGIADVDEDDLPDIIYAGRPTVGRSSAPANSSLIHAVNGLGDLLWTSHDPDGSPRYIYTRNGAPAFANFDDDDAAEIVWGTTIIDNDGTVIYFDREASPPYGGTVQGSNGDYLGALSIVADLTCDGHPEIIAGNQAWEVKWSSRTRPPRVALRPLWTYDGPDGFTAIADLDRDGDPEVILVGDPEPHGASETSGEDRDGELHILDGKTGLRWCGIDPSGNVCDAAPRRRTKPVPLRGAITSSRSGRGGPPVLADFDGDGRPEIAVAGATRYIMYDINRDGEDIVQPAGAPPPGAGEIFVRWTMPIHDLTSGSTGSSAFDFFEDGTAEALYSDECHFRIFDGATGRILLEIENSSGTIHEYPVVVDVDADGKSELLVVANEQGWQKQCGTIEGYVPRRGLFVYRGRRDDWPSTRQVWTSHSYHVTNATSSGTLPPTETPSWSMDHTNTYRMNPALPSMNAVPTE